MQTAKWLSVSLVLLIAVVVSASDIEMQNPRLPLLARLSYVNSRLPSSDTKQPQHICLSIYKDGHYRILRTNNAGFPQVQEGKLSHDQLNELQFLLNTDAFIHLSGTHGALVRGRAETFIAEVPRDKNVQRFAWTIADETRHFPKPAERIVQWLVDFEPVNARTVEQTEFPDICPRMQMSPVEPVAENFGSMSNGSCSDINSKAR